MDSGNGSLPPVGASDVVKSLIEQSGHPTVVTKKRSRHILSGEEPLHVKERSDSEHIVRTMRQLSYY